MLVFAFGITPKRTLHNVVATHKDVRIVSDNDPGSTHLSKSGFNCQCDNLISESPFVTVTHTSFVTSPQPFSSYLDQVVAADFSSGLFCSGLRGPPVC